MTTGTVLLLCAAAIIASILIGYKTNINVGFIAMGLAYLLGVFLLGMPAGSIINLWPVTITVQMIAILGFYGYANSNGTLQIIAEHIIYPFRKIPQVIPFVIFFTCYLLGAVAGGAACNGFMPVIGFTIALQAGWNPLLFAGICCLGAVVGSTVPFSQTGVMIMSALEPTEYAGVAENLTWRVCGTSYLVAFLFILVVYFVTGGYKVKKVEIGKPTKPNALQAKTLIIISIVVFFLVVPSIFNIVAPGTAIGAFAGKINLSFVCVLGLIACALLHLGNHREIVAKRIPWYSIITIAGVSILVGIMTASGATEYLAALISTNVPRLLIIPLFGLLAGGLSFFSAFFNTFPILFPLVYTVSNNTGINPVTLLSVIFLCSIATSVSPFSNGGMNVNSQCPDDAVREKLYIQQMVLAVCCLAFAILAGMLGLMNLFAI